MKTEPFTPKAFRDAIAKQAGQSVRDCRLSKCTKGTRHCIVDHASHDSTTQDSQKIAKYWKEKEGHCLGCNADIAVDEQYCKSCNDFLLETLPT